MTARRRRMCHVTSSYRLGLQIVKTQRGVTTLDLFGQNWLNSPHQLPHGATSEAPTSTACNTQQAQSR